MAVDYRKQWLAALAKTHPAAAQTFAGSPPPDPAQVTPDAAFLGQVAANQRPYETALSQFSGNVAADAADYGYTTSTDPNDPTKVTVGGIDTSNPYSRAALLQRSFENQQRGNTTSSASAGQLYAGSLQNAQNSAQRGFNQASTENRRGFEGLIRGYVNNLGGLQAQRDVDNATAYGGLVERLANDPNQPPRMYAGVPYTTPTAEDPFAAPLPGVAPTAQSVMASQSLRGTAWDHPIIGKYTPLKKPKPKRKP